MKTVFDKAVRGELIGRINALDQHSKALWGTMNLYQMLKHCTLWDEMIIHNQTLKRPLIGKLLGGLLLKGAVKDATPIRRNAPSSPELIVTEIAGDSMAQKQKWMELLRRYENFADPSPAFVHPFFGKMTKEQIGYFAYKHSDHHLRQFGV